MTLAEQGAYRNLLDELWLRGTRLPLDDRILAKISGDALEWPKVRSAVMARFYKDEDGYGHETHDAVQSQSLEFQESQREKGRKRAATAKRGADGKLQPNQPKDQPEVLPPDQPPSPSPDKSQEQSQSQQSLVLKDKGHARPKTSKTRVVRSPEALEVAEYLRDAILEHSPDHDCQRNGVEGWVVEIDRAIRINKRTPAMLKAAIDYAHRRPDKPFWRPNIQSGEKLRTKFDTLQAQAHRDQIGSGDAAMRAFLEEKNARR
jgi:uncharacterized protein YdaU (DUF1376 family)